MPVCKKTTILCAIVLSTLGVSAARAESGLHDLTRIGTGLLASIGTGPYGYDIEKGDLKSEALRVRSGVFARVQTEDGATYKLGVPYSRVELEALPEKFIQAIIATEDQRFFQHAGADAIGTTRAAMDWLMGNVRGGSGITQQLIKNQVVGPEISLERKLSEAVLAVRLTAMSEKQDVLKAYLDSVWFGRGWGAGNAAENWFGKPWSELSLSEIAFLAGILQGPALYDPRKYPARAHARRDHVLNAMMREQFISKEEHQSATSEELITIAWAVYTEHQDWVTSSAKRSLQVLNLNEFAHQKMDQKTAVIDVSINDRWQDIAQEALQSAILQIGSPVPLMTLSTDELDNITSASVISTVQATMPTAYLRPGIIFQEANSDRVLMTLDRETGEWVKLHTSVPKGLPVGAVIGIDDDDTPAINRTLEGAIVIIDVRNGQILANVGGYDHRLSGFDRTRAFRQPGSAIKPFVYLSALEAGLSPSDMISDNPITFETGYRPLNFEGKRYGALPLHSALAVSSNVIAVKLAHEIGLPAFAKTVQQIGIYDDSFTPYLPSALGASETTLERLVSGYAAFVNGGRKVQPHSILRIRKSDEVLEYVSQPGQQIFGIQNLEDMQSMLRGVITSGTAAVAFKGHPVSVIGKTGTSQDYRDALFIGITPDIAIGVWLGKDDSTTMGRVLGGTHAAPIAAKILKNLYDAGEIDAHGVRPGMSPTTLWPPKPFSRRSTTGYLNTQAQNPVFIERQKAVQSRPLTVLRSQEPSKERSDKRSTQSDVGGGFFKTINRNAHLLGN